MNTVAPFMHLDGCHFFVWVTEDGRLTFDERRDSDLAYHAREDCSRCKALRRGAKPLSVARRIDGLAADSRTALVQVFKALADIPGTTDE